MSIRKITEDIYKMRFEDIYGSYRKGRLSCEEASEILGISARSFYRKRQRYDSEEFDGHFDLTILTHTAMR